ncbi:hypothetical protein ACPCTO_36015 [Streptomyces olivoreticuli]
MLNDCIATTPGLAPVVLYAAADTDAVAASLIERARRHATDREWLPVLELTDAPAVPLADRTGWAQAVQALSGRTARGIVVSAAAMVADGPAEFEALMALARDRGAFLVEATGTAPRRTPGQILRRRVLHETASGHFPFGGIE